MSRDGDKVQDVIRVNELVQRDDLGLERGDTTLTGLVEGRARIPVGLNRTGGVGLTLAVRSRGRVSLRWNGTLWARGRWPAAVPGVPARPVGVVTGSDGQVTRGRGRILRDLEPIVVAAPSSSPPASTGIASGLLTHALARSVEGARLVGGRALLVNSVDAEAAGWWRRRGFLPAKDDPLVLFRSIADIAASLAAC